MLYTCGACVGTARSRCGLTVPPEQWADHHFSCLVDMLGTLRPVHCLNVMPNAVDLRGEGFCRRVIGHHPDKFGRGLARLTERPD